MSRSLAILSLVILLVIVGAGLGGPVIPLKLQEFSLPAYTSKEFGVEFQGGKRACAIGLGDGNSYVGLYVYDSQGNCVAWDDEGLSQTRDDLAVEWYPMKNGVYSVELHNCGVMANNCKLVLR